MSRLKAKVDNSSDYLYIDTVSIQFILRTKGDFITHDLDPVPFHPNMSDIVRFTNNTQILFPSFVKISQSDVNSNSKLGASRIELFTHIDLYSKFIKRLSEERDTSLTKTGLLVIDKDNNRDNDGGDNFKRIMVSPEYISKDEIIVNNIGVLKGIFFPINGKIFMLGHKFLITASRYISHEASEETYDYSNKRFKEPRVYTVILELNVLDATNNENIGDFSERSCIAKKTSILKDIDEIFITKAKSKIMMPINTLKTVMTVNRKFGKAITDWESRNIYKQPPRTEQEKRDFDNMINTDALMRNKRDYDEKMVEINNLPSGYVKELNKLDEDFKLFTKRSKDIDEMDNNTTPDYKNKLLKILFTDINKSIYTVENKTKYDNSEIKFVKSNNNDERTEIIQGIKVDIAKEIYDNYKETTDSGNKKITTKIKDLEKEFAGSDDEAERNEIKTKIEKLNELKRKNEIHVTLDTPDQWEKIVRSVDKIKKAVKDDENKGKIEATKKDNKTNMDGIKTKIEGIYTKLKKLNSGRRNIVDEDMTSQLGVALHNSIIENQPWPYFIPYIYSREESVIPRPNKDDDDISDTKEELIAELETYYASYIKLQNSFNTSKPLAGSISILRLQLTTLNGIISNTNSVLTRIKEEIKRTHISSSNGEDDKKKIKIVEAILKNQNNIKNALEEIITTLSDSNTIKTNENNKYIPSNTDGKIIWGMINNQNNKINKITTTDLNKKIKKYNTNESIKNKIKSVDDADASIMLIKLLNHNDKSTGGGGKLFIKKRFVSRNNKTYKKYKTYKRRKLNV